MAELWKPKDPEILKQWVNAIQSEGEELTDWEERFIADMDGRLKRGSRLTQEQENKIEEIYSGKTP